MKPERWREIERLYHAALGRPESERRAFLEGTCGGDETLRRQVESLLAGETQAEDFLESPAVEIAAKALAEEQPPAGASNEAQIGMVGKTLGHYRILEKIGAGGMGVVYRARDERLDRDVALKVLPRGALANEAARKRFRREALSLSRLNHPNIETVHDFDTQEGVDFLVMEYIAGEGLDAKVAAGPAAGEGNGAAGPAACRGAGSSPRAGSGPPRPEAGQPARNPRWPPEDSGLWAGQTDFAEAGRRSGDNRKSAGDTGRRHRGHASLHVP